MSKNEITLIFLHKLAREMNFELNDKECKNLLSEFSAIKKLIAIVSNIDTKNVLPLNFPFDVKKNYLRKDTVEDTISTENILAVAPEVDSNYIVIANKVVNNEEN